MKRLLLAAVMLVASPAVAYAQDTDGSSNAGFEPYVGVLAGGDVYDHQSEFGSNGRHGIMDGYLISAIAGVNVPLGGAFVGAEGNVAKGTNDIDWEYGVKGRVGVRTGTSGLIFGSVGYQWVDGHRSRGFPHRSDWMYGGGVEVGPADLGMGGSSSGLRLRLQAETYDFHSIRPMVGVVLHM